MKTFLINTIKELKKLSNELDVKSAICDREWIIFNDDYSVKEVYIFQKDGTLIASFNGKITYATWTYLSVNHSFIFKLSDTESYMFRPIAFDENILTLQLDGENRFCFLLTENLIQHIGLSLPALKNYLLQHCQLNLLSSEEQVEYDHQLALKKAREEEIARQQRLQEEQKQLQEEKTFKRFAVLFVVFAVIFMAFGIIKGYDEMEQTKKSRLEAQRLEAIQRQKEEEEERKRWNPEIYVTREENKQAVDLGLSVEWATCNVGANYPEEVGNYYCFGFPDGKPRKYIEPSSEETQEKSKRREELIITLKRQGLNPDIVDRYHSINISGTNEDMARMNWGEDWRLPTEKEVLELIDSCEITEVYIGDVDCFQFTGKNGNCIIIPRGGWRGSDATITKGSFLYIWTGMRYVNDFDVKKLGLALSYQGGGFFVKSSIIETGYPVRAVRDK